MEAQQVLKHLQKLQFERITQIRDIQNRIALSEALDSQNQMTQCEIERDESQVSLDKTHSAWVNYLKSEDFNIAYQHHYFEAIKHAQSNLNITEQFWSESKKMNELDIQEWKISHAHLSVSQQLSNEVTKKISRAKQELVQIQLEDRTSYMWGRL